jgi:hypothetical protein
VAGEGFGDVSNKAQPEHFLRRNKMKQTGPQHAPSHDLQHPQRGKSGAISPCQS